MVRYDNRPLFVECACDWRRNYVRLIPPSSKHPEHLFQAEEGKQRSRFNDGVTLTNNILSQVSGGNGDVLTTLYPPTPTDKAVHWGPLLHNHSQQFTTYMD